MEKEIINKQILFFRKVLSKGIELHLKSDLILGITKALFYFEHYGQIELTGKLYIVSTIVDNDGHNKQNNSYKLSLSKKGLEITSYHTFTESYGLHHESHEEVYYPNENSLIKDTLSDLEKWENNFLDAIKEEFVIEENINWKKLDN